MSEILDFNKYTYVSVTILGLKRVPYPILDLHMSSIHVGNAYINAAAAFPGSEAVVNSYSNVGYKNQILKINKHGQFVQTLYTCVRCIIGGLLVLGDNLYIVHEVGKIIKVNLSNTDLVQEYEVKRRLYMAHTGSLYFDPDLIPDKDLLIIPANQEVFTYRLSTKMIEFRIKTGKHRSKSITYNFYNNQTHYVVAYYTNSSVNVYDSRWRFVRTFGGRGSKDGELERPLSVIMSPEGTVIVGDSGNRRVSEFTMEGEFLCHLLVKSDGISSIQAMSFSHPHLWIVQLHDTKLSRYRLYEN